jgi:cytochrome c peroxidase
MKLAISLAMLSASLAVASCGRSEAQETELDLQLEAMLKEAGFTGDVDQSLERRLGRSLNPKLVELGKMVFFDKLPALHDDNSCAGCHAPAAGFGDWESIAIGVDSNDIVGPGRSGPHNQRRTPMVINNAFYPKLMWNGRFFAPSGDPFDNSQGYAFPDPEGTSKFPADDPNIKVLLAAQGHIPGTELPEMAGFTGITGTFFATQRFVAAASQADEMQAFSLTGPQARFQVFSAGGTRANLFGADDDPDFSQFDDGHGQRLPSPGPDGTRNDPIRDAILVRFNASAEYKKLFGEVFTEVAEGKPITFAMIAQALSEFQLSLTFANSPLDLYIREDRHDVLTEGQKRGAVVFFGKGNCSSCHTVGGQSNEMFSDFNNYNVGIPQISPRFGEGTGNVPFRDANGDFKVNGTYDFGAEDISAKPEDRFKFRTSPLRNLRIQKTYFHNGSFTRLEDAVRYHLDAATGAKTYDPARAGVVPELHTVADMQPVLASLDPKMRPVTLTNEEFSDLLSFLRDALFDPDSGPERLNKMIPSSLPSGRKLQTFEQ